MARLEKVKPTGSAGLALMGKGHSKELELEAEDAATRDTWVRFSPMEGRLRFGSVVFP